MNNLNQMVNASNPRNQFSNYFNNPAIGVSAPTNNIIWVQGIEGAKAWQLNPSSMAILLDSEAEGKMYSNNTMMMDKPSPAPMMMSNK